MLHTIRVLLVHYLLGVRRCWSLIRHKWEKSSCKTDLDLPICNIWLHSARSWVFWRVYYSKNEITILEPQVNQATNVRWDSACHTQFQRQNRMHRSRVRQDPVTHTQWHCEYQNQRHTNRELLHDHSLKRNINNEFS
jgi:hypothetical protein